MDDLKEEEPRKAWGGSPDAEVLKVLEKAELQSLTKQLGHTSICDNIQTGESFDFCCFYILFNVFSDGLCDPKQFNLNGFVSVSSLESLNPIEESPDATQANQVPLFQPCQPAEHSKQEVTFHSTVPITTEVKSQDLISPTIGDLQNTDSGESETEGENNVFNINV